MIGKDKQTQKVSENSSAVMAGKDAHVHIDNRQGMSVTEVLSVCQLYLESNFPKLREEALQESQRCVNEFGNKLAIKLTDEFDEKILEKLRTSDMHSSINDAVMYVARKGDKANIDVLCDLVVQKMKCEEDSENDIMASESIRIIEKINLNYMRYLALVYFIRNVTITNGSQHAYLNHYKFTIPSLFEACDISPVSQNFLQYAGLSQAGTSYVQPLHEVIGGSLNIDISDACYREELANGNQFHDMFPELSSLFKIYGFSSLKELDRTPLTDMAYYIAVAYLNSNGYNFDYPEQ